MSKKIFVNLAVKDLDKSVEFFKKLGFTFNPQFTDETATCMIISDSIFAMLLIHEKFKTFTKKEIADTTKVNEALISLSLESKLEVDQMIEKAQAAGSKAIGETNDYGFMYERSFEDLDGHIWSPFWMDPSYVQQS